ncbi:hypothetical protein GIB67_012888 [Kingdonia uniflora]|uniref:GDSL esterase/lipase n=1 Tax=Kingdonia uniflora TaxID=39325 RepID=A0A7J7NFI9_9MAGN|nr:hypothetical protein GIB67_012888 [Kingdonia uniflora]
MKQDLKSSIVLASVAGNDYTTYNARNGSAKDLPAFITSVVGQLTLNLKQIYGLGVGKIAIAAIEPTGCLRQITALASYTKCNETANTASNFHNVLLKQAVTELNNDTNGSPFVVLDVYSAFMTVFNGEKQGKPKFKNVLKPCCLGTSSGYSCGSVDEVGAQKYTLCKNPGSTFFWDSVHPHNMGGTQFAQFYDLRFTKYSIIRKRMTEQLVRACVTVYEWLLQMMDTPGDESSTEGSSARLSCVVPPDWGGSHDHKADTLIGSS